MTGCARYQTSLNNLFYLINKDISLGKTTETTLYLTIRQDSIHFHKTETNPSNFYKALGCLSIRCRVSKNKPNI